MLLIGIEGTTLQDHERGWLVEPMVAGVVLFKRNFESREQVAALIDSLRAVRDEPMLVCVDQEGGTVQRFREGFTPLPPLASLGGLYDRDPAAAMSRAEEHAWIMASEMRAIGVDLSFAPVADLARGNAAIGARAFHANPDVVSDLLLAYLRGMRVAGMAATLKHFPGHGSVAADTHLADAVDDRPLEVIEDNDLKPFVDAFEHHAEAVMMAHVRYPRVDAEPAGFSRTWIEDILRTGLNFRGAVFSDDIGMAAAQSAGGVAARVNAHLDAGCDFVLVCHPELVEEALSAVEGREPLALELVAHLQGYVGGTWEQLVDNPQRTLFQSRLATLDAPT